MAVDKAEEAEENDGKHHIMNEALSAIVQGFAVISTIGTPTSFTGPSIAEFLAEQSKDQLCHQLASTIGAPCSDYFYSRNVFLISVAPIDGAA